MADVAEPLEHKTKTKAKQRYLKRKKSRRKNAKQHGPKTTLGEGIEGDDATEEDEGVRKNTAFEDVQVTSLTETRPKKRRKVESVAEVSESDDEEEEVSLEEIYLPTPEAALPSFPAPTLPNAPSKTDLALQGLDKALIHAEFVDSTGNISIPDSESSDGGTCLSYKTRKRLHELGITELFAVQKRIVPFLLPQNYLQRGLYLPYDPPQDLCVSAPTGSGKTLAYVLPIIELLSTRIVTRLRALIVLPTRDLVIQVRETFEEVGRGRGLKICTATGQHSFAHEQSQLVEERVQRLQGGSSKVDILICTPGRLIDHLNSTLNFSLQHLRFLVIDEADRLLAQSFQGWLAQVLAATRPPKVAPDSNLSTRLSTISIDLPYPDAVAPTFLRNNDFDTLTYVPQAAESSCQKLLFSATLTREPDKIASLELHKPQYFIVQGTKTAPNDVLVMEKYAMPATLIERMLVCESSQKPLFFFHLVHAHNVTNALVFTKSTESTSRLVKLFDFFEQSYRKGKEPVVMKAYSSDLSAAERKYILEKFKAQEIHILVCSDLVSRGIDISHISNVVSYDAPVDIRKYVHRVGRTARAGRDGTAWTLVEEQEARYFKNVLSEADHLQRVKRLRVGEKDLQPLMLHYEDALKHLKASYSRA